MPEARFHGYDRDAGAIKSATENAERAGVGAACIFARQAVSDLEPPEGPPGLVIVNPALRRADREPQAAVFRLWRAWQDAAGALRWLARGACHQRWWAGQGDRAAVAAERGAGGPWRAEGGRCGGQGFCGDDGVPPRPAGAPLPGVGPDLAFGSWPTRNPTCRARPAPPVAALSIGGRNGRKVWEEVRYCSDRCRREKTRGQAG